MDFQFKLGQILQPKLAANIKLMVLQRIYIECPGGPQTFYECSLAFRGDYSKNWQTGSKNQRFYEIELENWVDEPAGPNL